MTVLFELVTVARQANIVDDILNVFNYVCDTLDDVSNSTINVLLADFIADVLPGILAFQSDQIVYLEVRGRQINGVTFGSQPLGSTDGEISGSALPPYVAYEFIYRRATALTRNGFKRFAGVIEEAIDQGGNVTGAVATALTAAQPILALELTADGVNFFRPIILGDPIPPATEFRIGEVDAISFQRVSTQNSRKPWN